MLVIIIKKVAIMYVVGLATKYLHYLFGNCNSDLAYQDQYMAAYSNSIFTAYFRHYSIVGKIKNDKPYWFCVDKDCNLGLLASGVLLYL